MRINIIQPTHYKDPVSRRLFKVAKLSVSPLTLPYLAALMPKGIDLRLMDERTGGLDINAGCDAVFITTWTLNSLRAYELARIYRDHGVKVVMGGPHCYFYTDEASGGTPFVWISNLLFTAHEADAFKSFKR